MLSEKIDDLYLAQSFPIFEIDAHKQIGNGTTIDEISKHIYKISNKKSVDVTDDFATERLFHISITHHFTVLHIVWKSSCIVTIPEIQVKILFQHILISCIGGSSQRNSFKNTDRYQIYQILRRF